MQFFATKLSGWAPPADIFVAFYSAEPNAFWLDRENHPSEAYSVIGASNQVEKLDETAFEQLQKLHAEFSEIENSANSQEQIKNLPFQFRPGLVGYLSYELKVATGGGARFRGPEPMAEFLWIDRAIVFDHRQRQLYFVGIFANQTDFDDWYHAALLRLTLLGGDALALQHRESLLERSNQLEVRHDENAYLAMIETAQKHIAAGDVYQICLTNQVSGQTNANPLATFLKLRSQNPAPYANYLKIGDRVIVGSSPESFLSVSPDGLAVCRPIKGTRKRSSDLAADEALRKELLDSEKERAENLMIVDLVRNDFSAVSIASSVTVDELFVVESYATVHQLVSTVSAKLAPGENSVSALRALYPGGSMTGAPKIRAMQLIDDLEKGARGIYSGAIGFFGFDGSADFSMTIRTLVFSHGTVSFGIGGGITAESDPISELAETQLKAKALLNCLGAASPWRD